MKLKINKQQLKRSARVLLWAVSFIILCLGVWLFRLNNEIKTRLGHGWFKPPVEIYSRGDKVIVGQKLGISALTKLLNLHNYRERFEEQTLRPGDYSRLTGAQCNELVSATFDETFDDTTNQCVVFYDSKDAAASESESSAIRIVMFDETDTVLRILTSRDNKSWSEIQHFEFAPQLFAQFYNDEPIMRTLIEVGDAPLVCLQAVTAIEDSQFLEHRGVSVTGLFRALIRNTIERRYAQGGSTITQQLVKNYFLTSEKTLRRKISELAMAVLLEANTDKDQILESYLNIVYMGQRGPFQVIGLAAASDYYFAKPLNDLSLAECSLLAAIINSPGRYNPFSQPERAMTRRNLVLDRMVETQMIDLQEAQAAKQIPLPKESRLRLTEPAPYFVQAIYRELSRLGISTENGLKIYSTLDVVAQDLAQRHVLNHVTNLEKNNPKVAKLKTQGKQLEASLISVEVQTGEVLALVGGRQYIKTQYNRVLDAHRQVGSLMKPFVFLAALESQDLDGEPYGPLSSIDDVAFSYNYEGQSWSPQNYTKKFYGRVPLFYALKNSLNAATAKLGIQVGLDNVVEVAKRAGVVSKISPLPSLTLGAFELYPWEVATAITTLARLGSRIDLSYIRKINDFSGQTLYAYSPTSEQVFAPDVSAILVGMMKQTLQTGTGRLAKIIGFQAPAAGKTGTTSDNKDTWFAGFTPNISTITWTGYDDNTPSGLTGASGALPLWTQFMLDYSTHFPPVDFNWPESVRKIRVTPSELRELVKEPEDFEVEFETELIGR